MHTLNIKIGYLVLSLTLVLVVAFGLSAGLGVDVLDSATWAASLQAFADDVGRGFVAVLLALLMVVVFLASRASVAARGAVGEVAGEARESSLRTAKDMLWELDRFGQLGPVLGLIGTMVGMASAFAGLGGEQGGGSMVTEAMADVSVALITTVIGNMVMLMGSMLSTPVRRRVRELERLEEGVA